MRFYGSGQEGVVDVDSLLKRESLPIKDFNARPSLLSDEEQWLVGYLPSQTKKEVGKNLTHEISTDVLPNLDV